MLVTFNDVSFKYIDKILLNKVNFTINETDKIGLLGVNGTGKSTLLKLLVNELEPTSGIIYKKNNIKIAYLPQETSFVLENTILEEIATNIYDITAFSSASNSSGLRHNVEVGDIIRIYKPLNEVEKIFLVYKGNQASYNPNGKPGGIAGTTGLYNSSALKTSNPCIPGGTGNYFYGTGYVSGYIVNVKDGFVTFTTQDLSVEEYDPENPNYVTGVIPYYNYATLHDGTSCRINCFICKFTFFFN